MGHLLRLTIGTNGTMARLPSKARPNGGEVWGSARGMRKAHRMSKPVYPIDTKGTG